MREGAGLDKPIPLLVICGPTAAGKTALALELAQHLSLEIISADSRQVYRRMNIGTAKPSTKEQAVVPHHLLDLIDPDQEFSVAEFVDLARPLIEQIHRRGRLPCVVGGTGLYIRALLGGLATVPGADQALRQRLHAREAESGPGTLHQDLQRLDPAAAEKIHPRNLVRIVRALEIITLSGRKMSELHADHQFADQPYRSLQLAPDFAREELFRRIDLRAGQMLEDGLVQEVEDLVDAYSADLKALQTLGYREVLDFLARRVSVAELLENIRQHTRQYAKRQLTWFRKDREIIWVDSSTESGRVLRSIENFIQQ